MCASDIWDRFIELAENILANSNRKYSFSFGEGEHFAHIFRYY
jgi:hypothetical protein